jgi:peptide/nickel transport system permease protein
MNTLPMPSPSETTARRELDEQLALSPWRVARGKLARHRGAQIGFVLVGLLVLAALLAPWLAPHDPYEQDLLRRLLPPVWDAERGTWAHPLGTDHLGRDYLSRLLFGAQISLTIGVAAAAIGAVIGTTLGVIAGFFGGFTDRAVNYLLTCQLALPGLLLAMALVFLIGPSTAVVIVVIGLLHWTYFLVVARSTTQQLRSQDFVAAARAAGASPLQLLWHEVLPNLRSQLIVVFTLEVGLAIVAEASLSFLGVGVPSPTPSWGLMISEGRNFMFLRPELVLLPGLALFVLVVGINLLGDGLRDATATGGRS